MSLLEVSLALELQLVLEVSLAQLQLVLEVSLALELQLSLALERVLEVSLHSLGARVLQVLVLQRTGFRAGFAVGFGLMRDGGGTVGVVVDGT